MVTNNNVGVFDLLASAKAKSTFKGTKYCFRGDLCQMATAENVAHKLNVETDREGGIPFVISEEDYDKVTKYMVENRIEGWWHYVTNEEYRKLTGKE